MPKFDIYVKDDNPNTKITMAYAICTTPRSGSNLLMLALQEQGLGQPNEYFNYGRGDLYNYFKHHQPSLPEHTLDYLDDDNRIDDLIQILINNRCSTNGVFGTKVFAGDMYYLDSRFTQFRRSMPTNAKYICLKRKDIIAQAVSMHIAIQTQEWFKKTDSKPKTRVEYDFEQILEYFQEMKQGYQYWEATLPKASDQVMTVYYSDLATDFEATIEQVNNFLGYKDLKIPRPPIQKQHNPIKDTFCKLFKSDLMKLVRQQKQS